MIINSLHYLIYTFLMGMISDAMKVYVIYHLSHCRSRNMLLYELINYELCEAPNSNPELRSTYRFEVFTFSIQKKSSTVQNGQLLPNYRFHIIIFNPFPKNYQYSKIIILFAQIKYRHVKWTQESHFYNKLTDSPILSKF